MVQQENHRLNVQLQEAKGRQEEQGAQAQRLKDKVAHMKDTLGQTQQRVVSEGLQTTGGSESSKGFPKVPWPERRDKNMAKLTSTVLNPDMVVWGGFPSLFTNNSLGTLISTPSFS
jgi:hypothetical protein